VDAIDPNLRIGAVTLAVSDLPRAVGFYERVLGLRLLEREQRTARLGAEENAPVLTLVELERASPLPVAASGLYHVAWLLPSRAELAQTVRRIAAARWPLEGAADHGVSEALYLSDPDGLGIEVYADRPRESWTRRADGAGVKMVSEPLDLEDLLAQAPAQVVSARMAAGTTIGHVHLKVADVQRSEEFYRDALGFEEQARLPSAAFVSAGGYHHHVGMNSWQSAGAPPAPASAPGLRAIDFELSAARELEQLRRRVSRHDAHAHVSDEPGNGLALHDCDGQLLRFHARAA